MFGRKTGLLAAMVTAVMLFGGCGNAGNNLGGTMNGDGGMVYGENTSRRANDGGNAGGNNGGYGSGTYSSGGTAYWDGYGVNNGRTMTGNNNTERNTYGMRTDGTVVGYDVQRAVDDLTSGRTRTDSAVN